VDDNEEVFLTPDFAPLEDPYSNLTSLLSPDITAAEEMDQDPGLTLVSGETENSLAARSNINFYTTSNGILDSREEVLGKQRSSNDDCEAETSSFEF
jgi:hypothetical protein